MSALTYIASDAPLETVTNPHYKTLSVNQALAMGMDVPRHMLAEDFDRDQPDALLWSDIEIVIDTVNKTVDDGGHDDNFAIIPMDKTGDMLTKRRYCACLEWQYTPGRAAEVIDYLREQLAHTGAVELWRIWMENDGEHDAPPPMKKAKMSIDALTEDRLAEIEALAVWRRPVTHHCFTLLKSLSSE